MLRWPQPVAGSDIVVTPAVLEHYQENSRQLGLVNKELLAELNELKEGKQLARVTTTFRAEIDDLKAVKTVMQEHIAWSKLMIDSLKDKVAELEKKK